MRVWFATRSESCHEEVAIETATSLPSGNIISDLNPTPTINTGTMSEMATVLSYASDTVRLQNEPSFQTKGPAQQIQNRSLQSFSTIPSEPAKVT